MEDDKKQVVGLVGDAKDIEGSIKKGDWEHVRDHREGNHLQQFINGKQTVDVTDDCSAKRAMTGLIALQLHAGPPMMAQFKNVLIKSLTP